MSSKMEKMENREAPFFKINSLPSKTTSSSLTMEPNVPQHGTGYEKIELINLEADMRDLQRKIKDQEMQLNYYKDTVNEINRLKEKMGTMKKLHVAELLESEEKNKSLVVRYTTAEADVETLYKCVRELQSKNYELTSKLSAVDVNNHGDSAHVHSELLVEREKFESENLTLRLRVKNLESNLDKVQRELNTSIGSKISSISGKGKKKEESKDFKRNYNELKLRCMQLTQINKVYEEELLALSEVGYNVKSVSTPRSTSNETGSKEKRHRERSEGIASLEELSSTNSLLTAKLKTTLAELNNFQEMHNFLRETVDKIKKDNAKLCEQIQKLRANNEEKLVKTQSLQATVNGLVSERKRMKEAQNILEEKVKSLSDENKIFKKTQGQDTTVVQNLQSTINTLQKQYQNLKEDMGQKLLEWEEKMCGAQSDVTMEKERADSCLAESLAEREKLESRWQDRWNRHQQTLTDQLESLKKNYDTIVKSSKGREESLQAELKELTQKLDKETEYWEKLRKTLTDQITVWKNRCSMKGKELESLHRNKVEVELMYQEKSKELDRLQETIREECEERQELIEKVVNLEHNMEQFKESNDPCEKTDSGRTEILIPLRVHSAVSYPNPILSSKSKKLSTILDAEENLREDSSPFHYSSEIGLRAGQTTPISPPSPFHFQSYRDLSSITKQALEEEGRKKMSRKMRGIGMSRTFDEYPHSRGPMFKFPKSKMEPQVSMLVPSHMNDPRETAERTNLLDSTCFTVGKGKSHKKGKTRSSKSAKGKIDESMGVGFSSQTTSSLVAKYFKKRGLRKQ